MRERVLPWLRPLLLLPAAASGFVLVWLGGFFFDWSERGALWGTVVTSTCFVYLTIKYLGRHTRAARNRRRVQEIREVIAAQELIGRFLDCVELGRERLLHPERLLPESKDRLKRSILLHARHLRRRGKLDGEALEHCRGLYGSLALFVCERRLAEEWDRLLPAIPGEKKRLEREFELLVNR